MSILHKRVPLQSFLSKEHPLEQAHAMLLLFTKVDWAGTREAISAFLTCPLVRNRWGVAWDLAQEKGWLQTGPIQGRHTGKPRKFRPLYSLDAGQLSARWSSRFHRDDHHQRFRTNRMLFLSKAGVEQVYNLGYVRASYGWRSTKSDASGVAQQNEKRVPR